MYLKVLVFLIFFILLIITLIVIFVHSKNSNKLSQYCSTDSDCPTNFNCRPNPEDQNKLQCFPSNKIFCPITPTSELIKCRLDATGFCSDTCLNVPAFSCVPVDSEHPYVWKQGNKTINMPSSPTNYGWCLPDVINRNVTCNEFTSDYILEEVGGDGSNKYQWGCFCKYPNLFDHDPQNPVSDCTVVRACGNLDPVPQGSLYVPKPIDANTFGFTPCTSDSMCGPGDKCLNVESPAPCGYLGSTGGYLPRKDCSDPKSNCVCHTNWLNVSDQIDPLVGQCVCKPGNEFQCIVKSSDYFLFNCAQNKICNGYDIGSPNTCNPHQCYQDPNAGQSCVCCNCQAGYIRCPDDCTEPSLKEFCQLNGPTCIPDPCNSASLGQPSNGFWSYDSKACICASGFIAVADENNAVGSICVDPCNSLVNPCGNRGKCKVVNNRAQCCDCSSPFTNEGDNTCTCSSEVPGAGDGNGAECCNASDCASGRCAGANCSQGLVGLCTGPIPIAWPCIKDGTPNVCIPKQVGPVICGTGSTASCAQGSTCCQNNAGSWNCCPYDNATCCSDNIHCCPSDHPVCNVIAGYCLKADGSDAIPFQGIAPGK